jgi:predicted nuclease with RNAse H fold
MYKAKTLIAGIDLASSSHGVTGIALGFCSGRRCKVLFVNSSRMNDAEILAVLNSYGVGIVVMDAPLYPPDGRPYRTVERKFLRIGGRLLPLTMESMEKLAVRAVRLANAIASLGAKVWETHPSSVMRISMCTSVYELLEKIAVQIPEDLRASNRHEVDALISLAVGFCLYRGCAGLVCAEDGCLAYIPHYKCKG